MAELSELESKVAEVMGLAQAAQIATSKVGRLVDDEQVARTLEQMGAEAAETERRCAELAGALEGKKTAIRDKAREAKSEAAEMMSVYLGDDADGLDGLEFLIMAEAGELGHVEIVEAMNEEVGDERVRALVGFVRPLQEHHVAVTREAALGLARQEAREQAAA